MSASLAAGRGEGTLLHQGRLGLLPDRAVAFVSLRYPKFLISSKHLNTFARDLPVILFSVQAQSLVSHETFNYYH
jgi:hypothetical protein